MYEGADDRDVLVGPDARAVTILEPAAEVVGTRGRGRGAAVRGEGVLFCMAEDRLSSC